MKNILCILPLILFFLVLSCSEENKVNLYQAESSETSSRLLSSNNDFAYFSATVKQYKVTDEGQEYLCEYIEEIEYINDTPIYSLSYITPDTPEERKTIISSEGMTQLSLNNSTETVSMDSSTNSLIRYSNNLIAEKIGIVDLEVVSNVIKSPEFTSTESTDKVLTVSTKAEDDFEHVDDSFVQVKYQFDMLENRLLSVECTLEDENMKISMVSEYEYIYDETVGINVPYKIKILNDIENKLVTSTHSESFILEYTDIVLE